MPVPSTVKGGFWFCWIDKIKVLTAWLPLEVSSWECCCNSRCRVTARHSLTATYKALQDCRLLILLDCKARKVNVSYREPNFVFWLKPCNAWPNNCACQPLLQKTRLTTTTSLGPHSLTGKLKTSELLWQAVIDNVFVSVNWNIVEQDVSSQLEE